MFPSRADGSAAYSLPMPDDGASFAELEEDFLRVQVMRGEEYPLGNLTGAVWYGP